MRILIVTQYRENYGTEAEPYWKNKGGEEIIVEVDGFRFYDDCAGKKAQMIVDELTPIIEVNNAFQQEYVIDWEFVEDDYQSWFEKSQLEYDGEIKFPAKRVTYEELMETA